MRTQPGPATARLLLALKHERSSSVIHTAISQSPAAPKHMAEEDPVSPVHDWHSVEEDAGLQRISVGRQAAVSGHHHADCVAGCSAAGFQPTQMFVIKNLDTGLEMRIDDFDRLANIATNEVQVSLCSTTDRSTASQKGSGHCPNHQTLCRTMNPCKRKAVSQRAQKLSSTGEQVAVAPQLAAKIETGSLMPGQGCTAATQFTRKRVSGCAVVVILVRAPNGLRKVMACCSSVLR